MKKSDLTGWKNVYAFTFLQHYKSKAAVIALILMCLAVIASGPVLAMIGGEGIENTLDSMTECKIEGIYLRNETDFEFDTEKFISEKPYYKNVKFIKTDDPLETVKEKFKSDSTKDVIVNISLDTEEDIYKIDLYRSQASEIDTTVMSVLSEIIEEYFYDCRVSQLGITEESFELINAKVKAEVVDTETDDEKEDDDSFNMVMSGVIMAYAMVVMMIVLISSQQIGASIIIEKSSKVIETLMISVRPLALIVGKIFGTITILICDFVALLISGIISGVITTVMTAKKMNEILNIVTSSMSDIGNGFSPGSAEAAAFTGGIDISIGRIVFGIFAILMTTILAYLLYAVISGISGASCSNVEDLSGASTFISMITLVGLYLCMGVTAINNDVVTTISYFFPFSGMYIVPVHFIFGKTGIVTVLILWAELIVLTVILFRFAARIYHVLVFHKGERIKFKALLGIAKAEKGQGKQ